MTLRQELQAQLKDLRRSMGESTFNSLTKEHLYAGLISTTDRLKVALEVINEYLEKEAQDSMAKSRFYDALRNEHPMCYIPSLEATHPGAEFRGYREYASCDPSDKPTTDYSVGTLQMILREHQKVSPARFEVIIPKYLGTKGLANDDLIALNKAFEASYTMALEENTKGKATPKAPRPTSYRRQPMPAQVTKASCPLGLDCPGNGDCSSCYDAKTPATPLCDPKLAWWDGWKHKDVGMTDAERRLLYGHKYADEWNKGCYARYESRIA